MTNVLSNCATIDSDQITTVEELRFSLKELQKLYKSDKEDRLRDKEAHTNTVTGLQRKLNEINNENAADKLINAIHAIVREAVAVEVDDAVDNLLRDGRICADDIGDLDGAIESAIEDNKPNLTTDDIEDFHEALTARIGELTIRSEIVD